MLINKNPIDIEKEKKGIEEMKKRKGLSRKRFLATLLSLTLILSLMPSTVLAEEADGSEIAVAESVVDETSDGTTSEETTEGETTEGETTEGETSEEETPEEVVYELGDDNDGLTERVYTISEDGTYNIAEGATGTIAIAKGVKNVTFVGDGAEWDEAYTMTSVPCDNLFIDATAAPGVAITLEDVYISNDSSITCSDGSGCGIVGFDGTGNTLKFEGVNVLDYEIGGGSNPAGIHIAQGDGLTIAGEGTLYFYKSAQGAGIGGSSGELNGNITFKDLTMFAKGSKQGALIGAGSGSAGVNYTPGFVKFVSGTYNLVSISRGAVVGGSAGSSGGSSGTTVYIEKNANVNINVDFSGAAVGGGGYAQGNDSSGGYLYVNGGSLRAFIDSNAANNATTGWEGKAFTAGANDAAITARRLNTEGEDVYWCIIDTALLWEKATTFDVDVDGVDYYNGGLHEYGFVQEALDKNEQMSITSTPSNWYKNDETNLYLYVTGEDHEITVNGETYIATWNEEANEEAGIAAQTFAVEKQKTLTQLVVEATEAIEAIGEVEYSTACEEAIAAARAAYDTITTDAERASVENYDDLLAAEAAWEELAAMSQITSIEVTTAPTNTVYAAGEKFDTTGMAVTATTSDGKTIVLDEVLSSTKKLTVGTTSATVSILVPVKDAASKQLKTTTPVTVYDMSWYTDVTGTEYKISNKTELEAFAYVVNGTIKGIAKDDFAGKTVVQTADIVLDADGKYEIKNGTFGNPSWSMTCDYPVLADDAQLWTPIGTATASGNDSFSNVNAFAGTYDGAGYKVTGLYTDESLRVQGLFGYVTGTIKNLTVDGCVMGDIVVGGIAAVLDNGTVENCTNNAAVFAAAGQKAGSGLENGLSRTGAIGGIIGNAKGTSFVIKGCFNNGDITCANTNRGGRTGGIVGLVDGSSYAGTIANCGNAGDINSYQYAGGIAGAIFTKNAPIDSCYNTGKVWGYSGGSTYVGGIVGSMQSNISNCYNTGDFGITNSGKSAHDGGIVSDFSGTSITNCYNTGTCLTPGSSYGVICGTGYGNANNTKLVNCYSTTTTGEDYENGCVTLVEGIVSADLLGDKFDSCKENATLLWEQEELHHYNANGYCIECEAMGPTKVTEVINAIGAVEFTSACEARIDAARAAYDCLNATEKAEIKSSIYRKLTNAESNFALWERAAETESIEVAKAPTYSVYADGATFNVNGMTLNAKFPDGATSPVSVYFCTYDKEPLTLESTEVTITYTVPLKDGGSKAVTTTVPVKVYDMSWYTDVEGKEYQIDNKAELESFAHVVNGTISGVGKDSFKGKTVTLTADIALDADGKYEIVEDGAFGVTDYLMVADYPVIAEDAYIWTPIAANGVSNPTSNDSYNKTRVFAGTFDGGNHKITGLYTDGTLSMQGLFGYVTGTVKNVTVDGCVASKILAGGIAAVVDGGKIENCTNNAYIYADGGQVANSGIENGVSYGGAIGGIVGYLTGEDTLISTCVNNGNVVVTNTYFGGQNGGIVGYVHRSASGKIEKCGNNGFVDGYQIPGGIVSWNVSTSMPIDACYNTGNVRSHSPGAANFAGIAAISSSDISNCYNTGNWQAYIDGTYGDQAYGCSGIVGDFNGKHITNCYNTGYLELGETTNVRKYDGVICGQINGNFISETTDKIVNCYSTVGMSTETAAYDDVAAGRVTVVEEGIITAEMLNAEVFENCVNNATLIWEEAVEHKVVVDEAKDATCTEAGLTEGSHCSECDKVFVKSETIAATGHNYEYGECTACGAEDPEYVDYAYVARVAGASRYATSLKAADELKAVLGVEQFDTVIVATGEGYADALSGSYLATVKNAPILLINEKSEASVKAYIKANLKKGGTVYVLGGTAAVSADMSNGLSGYNVKRLAGANRYETNIAILEEAGVAAKEILVCTGTGYADSLSASATGRPILLVGNELTDTQKAYVLANAEADYYVIGGTGVVSEAIAEALDADRIGGTNRYETSVLVAETFCPDAKAAVIAYAGNFPDGLCGGALAAAMKAPLILTADGHAEAAAEFVTGAELNDGIVLGGTGVIADETVKTVFGLGADDVITVK